MSLKASQVGFSRQMKTAASESLRPIQMRPNASHLGLLSERGRQRKMPFCIPRAGGQPRGEPEKARQELRTPLVSEIREATTSGMSSTRSIRSSDRSLAKCNEVVRVRRGQSKPASVDDLSLQIASLGK